MSTSTISSVHLVLRNPLILEEIIGKLGERILDHLQLRLVNPLFNQTVLKVVRSQYVEVVVSSIPFKPKECDEDSDDESNIEGFVLNNREINLEKPPKLFKFLNEIAKIRVESLIFKGFHIENNEIHDFVMDEFLKPHKNSIKSIKGAEVICDEGGCTKFVL